MPLEFVGCIGCDETLKEIFSLRFSRAPPRASQPSGHLQASQALNRMDSSQHSLSQPLVNRHTGSSKSVAQALLPFSAAGESNSVTCNCGQEAVLLTVRKQGPNQGRLFYKCSAGACNFFLWADSSHPTGGGAPATPALRPSGNSIGCPPGFGSHVDGFGSLGSDSDGSATCLCGQPAVTRTVQKDGPNKGRQFHTCAKPREQQCGFFQWVDENMAPGEAAGSYTGFRSGCLCRDQGRRDGRSVWWGSRLLPCLCLPIVQKGLSLTKQGLGFTLKRSTVSSTVTNTLPTSVIFHVR